MAMALLRKIKLVVVTKIVTPNLRQSSRNSRFNSVIGDIGLVLTQERKYKKIKRNYLVDDLLGESGFIFIFHVDN